MLFRDKTTGEYPLYWGALIERSALDEETKRANRYEINLALLSQLNADVVGKSSPPYNAPWQLVLEDDPALVGNCWVQGWRVEDLPGADPELALQQAKAVLAQRLAAQRYEKEVGGVVVAGLSIRTDRESQAQISAAYASLKNGLITSTQFKGADGWVTVTLAEMEPIARAVAEHVAACFGDERRLCEQLAHWDGLSPFQGQP